MSAPVFSFPAIPLRDPPEWSVVHPPRPGRQAAMFSNPEPISAPAVRLNRYYADDANHLLRLWCTQTIESESGFAWPLVLSGPSGVGKTILAESLVRRLPGRPVRTSGPAFQREFSEACATRSLARFQQQFLECDSLLVDDLTIPSGQSALVRQWVQLLDRFDQLGRPVVVTMPLAPFSDHGLPSALRSRLTAGLSITVRPPGAAARTALIVQLLNRLDLQVDSGDLGWLVEQLPKSFPSISRDLMRLALFAGGQPGRIDRQQLALFFRQSRSAMNSANFPVLLKLVARHFGIRAADVSGPGRQRPLVRARRVVAWLARNRLQAGYSAIGQMLGRRDASTIRHACRVIENARHAEPGLNQTLESLAQKLESRLAGQEGVLPHSHQPA